MECGGSLLPTAVISLADLQRDSLEDFSRFDELVARGISARAEALRVRKAITSRGAGALLSKPPFNSAGIYLWADTRQKGQSGSLVYVGIAKFDPNAPTTGRRGQTIEKRLSDYFLKEYTVLDGKISCEEKAAAYRRIFARLSLIHKPEQAQKYTGNHAKSYRMGRATVVLYSDANALGSDLEAVESALIISGNALQPQYPLVNSSKSRIPANEIGSEAWDGAKLTISSWMSGGLSKDIAQAWIKKIDDMVNS